MKKNEILEKFTNAFLQEAELEKWDCNIIDNITYDTCLFTDLDIKIKDLPNLFIRVEEEFNMRIPEKEYGHFTHVKDIVNYIYYEKELSKYY